MGRKNKSYSKDLHQQAYEKLTSMCCFSQSKKEIIKLASTKYEANLLIKDKYLPIPLIRHTLSIQITSLSI